ncbi:oligopeptide ABC transporter [Vibrio ishigakensis]|uniref:Oligopeptide ABC transporter n=1 Tax=Vibrio ishigakensis TaxID=1481914 RepID=A0A0B8PSN0_9VIBR|nr:oligopeptide ABC transporter [Vibrio ishigakensis]
MHNNKITKALFLGASLLATTTSFSTLAATVPAGTKLAKVQELVKGNGTEVASIDPQKTEGVPESNIIRDILEGLVNQDADGNTVPGVAKAGKLKTTKTIPSIYVRTRSGPTATQ